MSDTQSDFDSPWKEALERYFPPFLEFFFPTAHAGIDWQRGHEFLDTELQQVARNAELGRRLVDKLAKVWRRDGQETWVLVHVEVQGQEEADFAERMYVYNYRLFDRHHRQVASLAVLGDDRA
ncbi:MAG: cytosolic protein, partial [Chloroflexi bacterium]|nr:cytosolic protein [Chloroflexota bacterium]